MTFSLKNIQQKLTSAKKDAGPNPARDWHILLACTFFVFVFLCVWSYFNFMSVVANDAEGQAEVSVPSVKTTPIEDIQAIFAKRDALRSQYATPHQFVDPSL